jgi:flagellar basal body-associated protein FliL
MADAKDDDDDDDKKAADPVASDAGGAKPSFMKRMLPYIAGGAVSIGLGVGAGIVTNKKQAPAGGETTSDGKKAPVTLDQFPEEMKLDLPQRIFNCADTGQMIAGKVQIELEVRTTKKWAAGEKSPLKLAVETKEGRYSARIQDALVTLLSSKVSTELKAARGKEVLKLEILDLMNRVIFSGTDPEHDPQGVVTGVLFTEFLVQ